MKLFVFYIGLLALVGCNQKTTADVNADNGAVSEALMDETVNSGVDRDILSGELPEKAAYLMEALMGDTLVPMEVSCKDCTDPYKKYGFAFEANCYACNGIDIRITASDVYLIGSCGGDILSKTFRIENKTFTAKDEIVIAVKGAKFIFSKADKAEIYKLVVEGDLKLDADDPGVNDYFTLPKDFYYAPRKELHTFAVFDCGDFEG